MIQLDDRILEHLAEVGWSSPEVMLSYPAFQRLDVTRGILLDRCRILAHAELIEPFSDNTTEDMFELSIWGELYLDGQIDADLRRPIPKLRPPDKVRPRCWIRI